VIKSQGHIHKISTKEQRQESSREWTAIVKTAYDEFNKAFYHSSDDSRRLGQKVYRQRQRNYDGNMYAPEGNSRAGGKAIVGEEAMHEYVRNFSLAVSHGRKSFD